MLQTVHFFIFILGANSISQNEPKNQNLPLNAELDLTSTTRGDVKTKMWTNDYIYTPNIVKVSQKDIINRINNDKIIGVDNYNQFNQVNSEAQDFSRSLSYVMTDYDKRIRPLASAENKTQKSDKTKPRGPLEIESTIVVTAFGPVSDQHGEFTCQWRI